MLSGSFGVASVEQRQAAKWGALSETLSGERCLGGIHREEQLSVRFMKNAPSLGGSACVEDKSHSSRVRTSAPNGECGREQAEQRTLAVGQFQAEPYVRLQHRDQKAAMLEAFLLAQADLDGFLTLDAQVAG